MEEKGFSDFIAQTFKRAVPKFNPGMAMGELGSYLWNRLPDQADRFTRPGLRNKINSAVGTGMVEIANAGTDALLQAALAAGAVATAPETGGLSIVGHPLVSYAANIAKDALMSQYVEPNLYDLADNGINLGGRIPSPPGYQGSSLQRGVNTADKKVTDIAQFIQQHHPKNQALEQVKKGTRVIKKLVN